MAKPNSWVVDFAVDFAAVLLALTAGTTVNWALGVDASTTFTLGLIGAVISLAAYFALRILVTKRGNRS